MEYTVLDSLDSVQLFYNEVNQSDCQFHITITSIWGEILLDEKGIVRLVQSREHFGEYNIHVGKRCEKGGINYFSWTTIELPIGFVVPKEGAKESVAKIELHNEQVNKHIELVWKHKETQETYDHEHTSLQFMDIIFNSYRKYDECEEWDYGNPELDLECFDDIESALMEEQEDIEDEEE